MIGDPSQHLAEPGVERLDSDRESVDAMIDAGSNLVLRESDNPSFDRDFAVVDQAVMAVQAFEDMFKIYGIEIGRSPSAEIYRMDWQMPEITRSVGHFPNQKFRIFADPLALESPPIEWAERTSRPAERNMNVKRPWLVRMI
jgi:hypothetical protein